MFVAKRRETESLSQLIAQNKDGGPSYSALPSFHIGLALTKSEPVWRNGRAYDSRPRGTGLGPTGFSLKRGRKSALLGGRVRWELIGPSPHHYSGRNPVYSNVKRVPDACTRGGNCSPGSKRFYRLGVHRLTKPRCGEMSARSYALQSVYPQLSIFFF